MADGSHSVALGSAHIRALFDPETGRLDRRIYIDETIYKLELQRIFARGWNFMCHESQIPNTGDYFINYIGEDQVIVCRDGEGQVNVLLNTCRHRGNALCRAEQGNAKSFVCSYHGWNYGLERRRIRIPGFGIRGPSGRVTDRRCPPARDRGWRRALRGGIRRRSRLP